MNESYKAAIEYLYNRQGVKRGLENEEFLAEAFGNPHLKYDVVHVGGTNGKGSTSTFLAKILEEAGYRVGLFNSPHVDRFTERFRVNSKEIDEDHIVEIVEQVQKFKEIVPTFFEINTIIALTYFEKMGVDVAVIEAGLGGRLDSTNIVDPRISIITSIGRDHELVLGSRLEEIAFEKAGIIKKGKPILLGKVPKRAKEVIVETANSKDAPLLAINEGISFSMNKDYSFNVGDYRNLVIQTPGDHFRINAALAATAAGYFERVNEEHIREGLYNNDILPGRLELTRIDEKGVLFDVCHNVEGVRGLCRTLKKYFGKYKKFHVIAAIMENKNYNDMIRELLKVSDHVVLTTIEYKRCFDPNEVDEDIKSRVTILSSLKGALSETLSKVQKDELLCVVGSFYLMKEAREILLERDGGL